MKRRLHIDIETFCNVNLKDTGVYRYAADPSFKIILFAYSWDDGPVEVIDTYYDDYAGASLPADVWAALTDDDVEKVAHNAAFEFVCISTYYQLEMSIAAWRCTMIKAAYLGLPLGLDMVGKVLGLAEQKDARGKALIKYFCMPVAAPKKKDNFREINTPNDAPEAWREFADYCGQDVRVEVEVDKFAARFPAFPAIEWSYWEQDQEINGRGVFIDDEFIEAAIASNDKFLRGVYAEMRQLTGIANPNSLAQIKDWLEDQLGYKVPSLNKEYLADNIDAGVLPEKVARVLELRRLSSKASISKYGSMLAYAGEDKRIRGLFQFYGANRTGREAGRGVQPQNLKKTFSKGLETAKEAVRKGLAELLYDDVPDLISKLVRTALVAAEGKTLVVSDFAAIEARVLAWLAGEDWVLDVFRTHGKIYEATAARIFNVPIEMVTKGSDLRARGKVAALALGYQGAVGAMITMGAVREGLDEAELPAIVSGYRAANPKTVKFWRRCEEAAKHVVKNKTSFVLRMDYTALKFSYERGYLFIQLPSGRRLAYYGATVDRGKLRYWGLDQVKKIWRQIDTYGGMLVENITQATARDCLFDAMYRMSRFDIVMHIHDEIVVEAWDEEAADTLVEMEKIMAVSPLWAKGLPLEGDGYLSKYYKKD